MRKLVFGWMVIGVMGVMAACSSGGNESTKQQDSLFLGISLGMESKAFYDHCWEYNRRKILIHGPTNQNVEYKITEGVNSPVMMRFYPTFYEDKIFEMPVTFTYEAWAPWNRQFHSDSLFVQMIKVFKNWYGDDFKELDHQTMGKIYYRIDGKRRINLFIRDDMSVQAVFTDLKVERAIKKLQKEMEEKGAQSNH
jgi:hypothetical protein